MLCPDEQGQQEALQETGSLSGTGIISRAGASSGEAERETEREGARALAGLGLSGLHVFSLGLQGSWWLIRSN